MNKVMLILGFLLLSHGALAAAATIYRCGNTYSNTPCDKGKELAVPQSSSRSSDAESATEHVCVRELNHFVEFKDPESVRIVSPPREPPQAALIEIAGQKIVVNQYVMSINAKNSYGGYVGAKVYSCYVSQGSGKVLRITD